MIDIPCFASPHLSGRINTLHLRVREVINVSVIAPVGRTTPGCTATWCMKNEG